MFRASEAIFELNGFENFDKYRRIFALRSVHAEDDRLRLITYFLSRCAVQLILHFEFPRKLELTGKIVYSSNHETF